MEVKTLQSILGTLQSSPFVIKLRIWLRRFGIGKQNFPDLIFIKKLVSRGSVCINVSAVADYYPIILSSATGRKGKLFTFTMPQDSTLDNRQNDSFTLITESSSSQIQDTIKSMNQIDFIRLKLNGKESEILTSLKEEIDHYRPAVQSELQGLSNRRKVLYFFEELNYNAFLLNNGKLKSVSDKEILSTQQDFYFLPN